VPTLGIDLAAQPRTTASCEIDWVTGDVACATRVGDEALLRAARAALDADGIVAIDAPFGWPTPFVEAVGRQHAGGLFGTASGRALRLRTTDQLISGRPPLSVSADRIAVVAFRAARLLDALGPVRRDGSDRIMEVYPAAALRRWGLQLPHYKVNREARGRIVAAISAALPSLEQAQWAATCRASADALDAFVAALVGRAKHLGLVDALPPEQAGIALVEGWIWLPQADALPHLR
jgi:predicted nuclease with RNAse H fold